MDDPCITVREQTPGCRSRKRAIAMMIALCVWHPLESISQAVHRTDARPADRQQQLTSIRAKLHRAQQELLLNQQNQQRADLSQELRQQLEARAAELNAEIAQLRQTEASLR